MPPEKLLGLDDRDKLHSVGLFNDTTALRLCGSVANAFSDSGYSPFACWRRLMVLG